MSDKIIFQTLKLFPMQNLTETPPSLKKIKYIGKNKEKSNKGLD